MNTFAVLLICSQACLLQNAFAQYIGNSYGCMGAPFGAPFAYSGCAAYGGEGIGDVAVAGQLPVAGTTLVAGQVPIMGAVDFGGIVPAAGEVAIAGNCAGGCGCAGADPIVAAPFGASFGTWGAPYGACGASYAEIATPAFSGGALPIASASPAPPSGVSVLSDNVYAGELAVRGALPFLGTVGLEGVLPTAGAGAVAYGCGNGEVAMLTEGIGAFPRYGAAMAAPFGCAGYGRAFY